MKTSFKQTEAEQVETLLSAITLKFNRGDQAPIHEPICKLNSNVWGKTTFEVHDIITPFYVIIFTMTCACRFNK